MTYSQTFNTSNQNPWSDSNWTQSLASGLQLLSSNIQLVTADTYSFVKQNLSYSKTQSSAITTNYINDVSDLNSGTSTFAPAPITTAPMVLYTDATHFACAYLEYTGGVSVSVHLFTDSGGTTTDDIFSVAWDRSTYTVGDVFKLGVTWSGADAAFAFYINGTQLGSSITKTAFALTSGNPGWVASRNGTSRQGIVTAATMTGDGGTPGNATGAGATQNATAPTGTAAVTGVFPGYSNILRDTDTGTPLASATGLIMSYRTNSNDTAVAWSTTTGTTDATGKFIAKTGLAGSTGSMGAVGSSGYLTIENSAKTIVATYKITIVDLGS